MGDITFIFDIRFLSFTRNITGEHHTVWKFQDFSVIQILREINFGECTNCETGIFCHLKGSEFCQFDKFQPSKIAKTAVLFRIQKFDFT